MASNEMMRAVTIFFATLVSIMSYEQINVVNGDPQVPCFFIFGDSLSDNGNNNHPFTIARADYPPYGLDFEGGKATGRFTNGPTTVDYIAKLLGFEDFVPPFATATGQTTILKGVNYASGGAGIRNETGIHLGLVLSMSEQLRNHELTVSRITNYLVTPMAAEEHLNKCIYYSSIGNNDYLNNYLLPKLYTTRTKFTPEEYAQDLINKYRDQIKTLYDLGARKVVLVGNGLLGCTPYAISKFDTNGSACVDYVNNISQLFNNKLVSLVDELNTNFTNARFIYINTTGIVPEDPTVAGFTVLNKPCCQVLTSGQCHPFSEPCSNRNTYVFYDNYHPTSALNSFIANRSYSANLPSYAYPIDINDLAEL